MVETGFTATSSSLNNHNSYQTNNEPIQKNNFNVRYRRMITKAQFHFSPWKCSFIFSFVSVEYVSLEYNLFVNSKVSSSHFQAFIGVVRLTNRFHVAVRLFSNRSQMTSKCGKNKKVAHEAQPSVSLMFFPHFDVATATWNLSVLYNNKINIHGKNALLFQISPL